MKTVSFCPRAVKWMASLTLMIVMASCGSIPNPVIPLARTLAPQSQSPTQGHWEGTGPSVSFDVTADGAIRDFTLVGSLAMGRCTVKIDEIAIGETGKFESGQADSSPIRVTGELTNPRMFEGKYNIKACKGVGDQMTVVLNPEDKPWKAEWKGNVSPSTGASSALPTTALIETVRIVTENWTPTPPNMPSAASADLKSNCVPDTLEFERFGSRISDELV